MDTRASHPPDGVPPAPARRCPEAGCTFSPDDWSLCPEHGRCAIPVRPGVTLDTSPRLGVKLKDKYVLVERLGRGGFGEVYRALNLDLHERSVAVKLLLDDPEGRYRAALMKEMKALATVRHRGLLDVQDHGVERIGHFPNCPFMVSRFIEGQTLEARLAQGPLDIETTVHVFGQIANALAEAHAHAIVHRDLKPGNLMLERDNDGRDLVTIIDFGIARLGDTMTSSNAFGSDPYMSPEQVKRAKVGPRSDIYAMGTVLYEMLSGQRAFRTRVAHLTTPPPDLPGCDADPRLARINDVIHIALAKTPAHRHPDMLAFKAALEAAVLEPLPAPPPPASPAPATPTRWPMAALAVIVVGLVGWALAAAFSSDEPEIADQGRPDAARDQAPPPADLAPPSDAAPPSIVDAAPASAVDAAPPTTAPRCTPRRKRALAQQIAARDCVLPTVDCRLSDKEAATLVLGCRQRKARAKERARCEAVIARVKAIGYGPQCERARTPAVVACLSALDRVLPCGYCGDGKVQRANELCDGQTGCKSTCKW